MDEQFAEINITPFTDILLVLLIIFMILAALVVPPGFERALARRAAHDHRLRLGVVADARARYALVIRVLDAAKLAGITDVQFVSE